MSKRRQKRQRFRVRYARIVILETTVEAESEEDVADDGLPGVYDGIPSENVPEAVEDIQDYEHIWQVMPLAEWEKNGGHFADRDYI